MNQKVKIALFTFCPYRGRAGEYPMRTEITSKMCHFASLGVRLMRIKNRSRFDFMSNGSDFPHNVWSGYIKSSLL